MNRGNPSLIENPQCATRIQGHLKPEIFYKDAKDVCMDCDLIVPPGALCFRLPNPENEVATGTSTKRARRSGVAVSIIANMQSMVEAKAKYDAKGELITDPGSNPRNEEPTKKPKVAGHLGDSDTNLKFVGVAIDGVRDPRAAKDNMYGSSRRLTVVTSGAVTVMTTPGSLKDCQPGDKVAFNTVTNRIEVTPAVGSTPATYSERVQYVTERPGDTNVKSIHGVHEDFETVQLVKTPACEESHIILARQAFQEILRREGTEWLMPWWREVFYGDTDAKAPADEAASKKLDWTTSQVDARSFGLTLGVRIPEPNSKKWLSDAATAMSCYGDKRKGTNTDLMKYGTTKIADKASLKRFTYKELEDGTADARRRFVNAWQTDKDIGAAIRAFDGADLPTVGTKNRPIGNKYNANVTKPFADNKTIKDLINPPARSDCIGTLLERTPGYARIVLRP